MELVTYRCERGPWDGRVVRAFPCAALVYTVWSGSGEWLDVMYRTTNVEEGVFTAVYEGHVVRDVTGAPARG